VIHKINTGHINNYFKMFVTYDPSPDLGWWWWWWWW